MKMPGWPPRDWRALIALVASIFCAGLMTGLAFWLVWIIWKGGWATGTEGERIDALAKALFYTLGIILIVTASLGMAINRRSFKISKDGIEAEGGEESQ